MGLLLFIVALSLAVWGLEREPPYDVFRGYTHTLEADGGDGDDDDGARHERLTRERRWGKWSRNRLLWEAEYKFGKDQLKGMQAVQFECPRHTLHL